MASLRFTVHGCSTWLIDLGMTVNNAKDIVEGLD